jgi:hypothetical protein
MTLIERIRKVRAAVQVTKLRPNEATVQAWAKKWRCSHSGAFRNLEAAVRLRLARRRKVKTKGPAGMVRTVWAYEEIGKG